MRIAYVPRNEAISALKSAAPEDLLLEIIGRGVRVMPPIGLLNQKSKCPHCGATGTVSRDFGVRVLGGTVRPQSWCRDCRKNPKRSSGRGARTAAPENEKDMLTMLRASLIKAGIKRSDLSKLAKAMGSK